MKTMQTQITVSEGSITVAGPYSTQNNTVWRGLGGKFAGGEWHLPDNDTVRQAIAGLFGAKSEIIEALVPLEKADGSEILQCGGYVLASRRSRDGRVSMPHGVSLAAGGFPSRGGSVKNPRVAANDGTVFRLACRKSFAEQHGLELAPDSTAASIEI